MRLCGGGGGLGTELVKPVDLRKSSAGVNAGPLISAVSVRELSEFSCAVKREGLTGSDRVTAPSAALRG